MTSIDTTTDPLEAIKARVEGHTEGSWEIRGDHDELPAVWHDSEAAFSIGRCADCGVEAVYAPADAELIAAAPKLLAALEAVQALAVELIEKNQHDASFQAWGLRVAGRQVRQAIAEALA